MLRYRVFLAVFFALLLTVVGFWTMTGGRVLRPLKSKLIDQRVGVVVNMADQLEEAKNPMKKLDQLENKLNVQATLARKLPAQDDKPIRVVSHGDREISLLQEKQTPMAVQIKIKGPKKRKKEPIEVWLLVKFPLDLERPQRTLGYGVLGISILSIVFALLLTRWSIKPLDRTAEAMKMIAGGDLDHRVDDSLGPASEAFNQMAERLQGIIEGQKKLMAAISHELRTPLARLRLQMELLSDEAVSSSRVGSINEDIQELEDLVEALLASARLERGVFALKKEKCILFDICMEGLSKVDIGDREVSLELQKDHHVFVDKLLMFRVVHNLLSNIVRYTPPTSQIIFGSAVGDRYDHFWVADNGPGVAEDLLPSLFDPFVRAESSRNKVTGGLGLGLMLVRQVAEAHGGYVHAKNHNGLEIHFYVQKYS